MQSRTRAENANLNGLAIPADSVDCIAKNYLGRMTFGQCIARSSSSASGSFSSPDRQGLVMLHGLRPRDANPHDLDTHTFCVV